MQLIKALIIHIHVPFNPFIISFEAKQGSSHTV